MENIHNTVYAKQVVEFVAVANEFCVIIENSEQASRKEYIDKTHKILPLLYLKATLLPKTENLYDDFLDKYVSEDIYESIKANLEFKFGPYDAFTDVFHDDFQYSEAPIPCSISENMTDIYQDIKDFLMTYSASTDELMNDAIWECSNNFRLYWGQKLTNTLRALHSVFYSENEIEEDDQAQTEASSADDLESMNTKDWIISQRQEDFKDGLDISEND